MKSLLKKIIAIIKINILILASYTSSAQATTTFVDAFSVSAQENISQGLTFNSDGSKMYIVGGSGDDVNEYSLAQAYDVSTASFVDTFALVDSNPQAIIFNTLGDKMFIVGDGSNAIFEYALATDFDASSAINPPLSTFNTAPQTSPRGIAFNSNGTVMFIVGISTDMVFQYDLPSAFDLGVAPSLITTFDVSGQDNNPEGITFNNDGTKMFIVGLANDKIYEYSLTTAFDIDTASFTGSFDVSAQDTQPTSVEFNSDGTKMFVLGNTSDGVNEYTLSVAFELVDSVNPTLSSSVPSDDATDVAVDINIVLNFSESVDVESGNITIKKTSDDSTVETISVNGGLVSGSGSSQITVNPSVTLDSSTEYYVLIDATAFDDSVGNSYAGISSTTALSFTTSSSGSSGSLPNPTNDKDVVGSIEAQVESAKTSLFSSLNTVSNRLSYLRRNRSNDNLANNGIDFKFSNKMLASINDATSETKNELLDFLPKDWSLWTAGEISVHYFGDENNKSSREIDSGRISLGVDKKINENQLYGFAIQYGNSEADIGSSATSVDSENISLSIYGTKPHNDDQFVEGLIGVGKIDSDLKRVSGVNTLTGQRDGQQIFSSINYGKKIEKDNRNITPLVKLNLGYTELDEYSETGTNALKYHKQTFETGLISTGFEIDQISEFKNSTFKPYGALDYSLDFSSSSNAKMNYVSDSSTIYTYSSGGNSTNYLNALIGFDYSNQKGLSVNSSYKRKQGDNSEKADIFNFGLNFVTKRETEYALRLDQEEKLYSELNIGKNINGFDFSFNTNQIILQNPRPETNISISSKF
jgi:hypothetical protein